MRLLRGEIAVVFLLLILFPLGCGTDRNYRNSGEFEIANATIDGDLLRISEDKSTVVLDVGKNQLKITPRWVYTGIDIVVAFEHNGQLDFRLLRFWIDDNESHREVIQGLDGRERYPWYR